MRDEKLKKNMIIKFKVLRKYLSCTDKLSICIKESMDYKNFVSIKDVPDSYNDLYIYGIGMIESEFYRDGEYGYTAVGDNSNLTLESCIEIVLFKEL